jgi:hypothetical protein
MNLQSVQWIRRFNFLALSGWLIISLGLAVISFMYFGIDFRGYYAAARVLMEGGNPYDYYQVAPVLLQITGKMGNNPYYYPPWFAWLFVPIALFPFQIARGVWMAFNLAIWNISLWKLSQIVSWHQKGWRLYSLFILSTLTFGWITMRYEQASILVFFILVLTMLSIRNYQWNSTGFWLAFLLIKPNITLVTVVMICLWFIQKKQWLPVIVMALTLAVLSALAIWITPNLLQPFFESGFGQGLTVALDGPNQIVAGRINTTIFDWLGIFGIKGNLRLFIYCLFIVISFVVLALTLYRSKSLLELISVSLLISFVITPYALQYDYAPLVIVLFWALSLCISNPKSRRGGLLLAMFIFSVSIWQQNIAWGYWIVVGMVMLTILGNSQKYQLPDLSSST